MGVAMVESTTVNGPEMLPISDRSVTASRGFEGVSAITNMVRPGCTADANDPGTPGSTNVVSIPNRRHGPCRKESVAPYRLFCATMWLPWPQNASTTLATAPIPEPNASADSAPSSSATACSNAATVGFEYRP